MKYSMLVNKILKFVYNAHDGQKDKVSMPYIYHPFFLASQMNTEDEVILALLHDVVEDTDYTFNDIKNLGVSDAVFQALHLLTHSDETPYMDYINTIKTNALATKIKLADLAHNSDLTRIDNPTENDFNRAEKYKKAIKILREI